MVPNSSLQLTPTHRRSNIPWRPTISPSNLVGTQVPQDRFTSDSTPSPGIYSPDMLQDTSQPSKQPTRKRTVTVRRRRAAQGSAPLTGSKGTRFQGHVIRVHGHAMKVELEEGVASKEDLKVVHKALSRYKKSWLDKAQAKGRENGERLPRIRLVSKDNMPRSISGGVGDGKYERDQNTIYLNMDLFNDKSKESYIKRPDGRAFKGKSWLERTTVHEFAHFLDDAGTKQGKRVATDIGPEVERFGRVQRSVTERGAFSKGLAARNHSHHHSDYVTQYDVQTNKGQTTAPKQEETFAEILTEVVMGGPQRERELREHKTLGPSVRQALDYMDSGLDANKLSGPRQHQHH